MTEGDEVIAAVPSGLLYFKRVNDHVSKPWSEGRLLPDTTMLNNSNVSGLAAMPKGGSDPRLYVYCVSGGKLHGFYLSRKDGSSWVKDSSNPFSKYLISGTPAVAFSNESYNSEQWNMVVPCLSGGLLHAYTDGVLPSSSFSMNKTFWGPVNYVATDLGLISSVSIAATRLRKGNRYDSPEQTNLVVVCIARGRLHTVEGEFLRRASVYSDSKEWKVQAPTRIIHPGEVTGNPVLTKKRDGNQLDLLVPSAEGGVFHFVRTASNPDQWHIIARIAFPQGVPAASCLGFYSGSSYNTQRHFRAVIQIGGRLYYVTTTESSIPWAGSYLRPIVSPGPFSG